MQRGEIYSVDLGKGIGREFAGHHFAAVLSDDFSISMQWTVIVVPGFDVSKYPLLRHGVLVLATDSGVPVDLLLQATQIRAIDYSRFPKKPVGSLSTRHLDDLADAIKSKLVIK